MPRSSFFGLGLVCFLSSYLPHSLAFLGLFVYSPYMFFNEGFSSFTYKKRFRIYKSFDK